MSNLTPIEMLEQIEAHTGTHVQLSRDAYYFASVSGDQGGGFTREDAIKSLYDDVVVGATVEREGGEG